MSGRCRSGLGHRATHPDCSFPAGLCFYSSKFMNTISSSLQNIQNRVFCRPSITHTTPFKPLARRFVTSTPTRRWPPRTRTPNSPTTLGYSATTLKTTTRTQTNRIHSTRSLRTIANMTLTPAEILERLPARFEQARESGDLLFFPSTTHKHEAHGVEVCES